MLENEQALYGKMIKGIWRDIGKPLDLLQASLDVVDREGAKVKIEMNQPLRSDGFTVYQSNWGPQGASEGTR